MTTDRDHLLGIGELSRASGLSLSALRFYDREGVLVPADVDGLTGYRRYAPRQVRDARLLAGMRRLQVPVAEMTAVLDAGDDADVVEDLLAAHLARLERGLRDARREVGRLRRLVREDDRPVRIGVDLRALAAGLRTVRHAVAVDPALPVLGGVLLDRDTDGVRVVATDRYRLAAARLTGTAGGEPATLVLPLALVDRVLAEAAPEGVVTLGRHGDRVTINGALTGEAPALPGDYPDYRALLPDLLDTAPAPDADGLAGLDVHRVRRELAGLRGRPRVHLDPAGAVSDAADDLPDREPGVLVDPGFLWDALDAVEHGMVQLPGGGSLGPLAVRAEDDAVLALVMPLSAGHRS